MLGQGRKAPRAVATNGRPRAYHLTRVPSGYCVRVTGRGMGSRTAVSTTIFNVVVGARVGGLLLMIAPDSGSSIPPPEDAPVSLMIL